MRGRAPDGRAYSAGDPHLLEWVHIAEIDSFLRAHQRYGSRPLDQAGCDGYVADTARIARELGVLDPPETEAALADRIAAFRPELAGSPEARSTARFLLLDPPLALAARAPYALLAAAAVELMPPWARAPLRLPYLPVLEADAGPRRRPGRHDGHPVGDVGLRGRLMSKPCRGSSCVSRRSSGCSCWPGWPSASWSGWCSG